MRCGGIGYSGPGALNFDSVSPTVQNSMITKNAFAGISTNNSSPILIRNCIAFNPDFGLYNSTPGSVVDATSQWWGASSGPYHPAKNPNGKGNKVSDGVNFAPWSTYCQRSASYSSGPQDGWILESGEFTNVGGTMNAGAATISVGDDALNRQQKGFLSFNTASIPDNAVITSVSLRVCRQSAVGTNPFATHGNLLVDVRQGAFSGNAALQIQDFQASASKNGFMTIPNRPSGCWYSKTLTFPDPTSPPTYINKVGVTQFRLRFRIDDNNDGGVDVLKFYSGNSLTPSLRPQLIIQYYVP